MPLEVIMPALGMAQDTGQIVAWHKASGDKVVAGDVLFEVETDKATMEVEAAGDGYLVDISAGEGDDVPVGNVIARIADSPEGSGSAPPDEAHDTPEEVAASPSPDTPAGKDVIMPALGMAQDTGRIVTWAKAPGDAVAAGDVLFEVETDKATMEVEAGHDGYLAAILALEGEDAPVGGVIAVISADKPENPVSRSIAEAAPAASKAQPEPAQPAAASPTQDRRGTDAIPTSKPAPQPAQGGRILASPKARRLAAEQGLDLARLAEAGAPQPYHVADLERLKALPAAAPEAAPATAAAGTARLSARVPAEGYAAFRTWLAAEAKVPDTAVWAAFAAASLRAATGAATVTLRHDRPTLGRSALYQDPDLVALSAIAAAEDGTPDAVLRDLTASRITGAGGAGALPTLTLARDGEAYALTLDHPPGALDPDAAIQFLDGFAARLEEPLRHLL